MLLTTEAMLLTTEAMLLTTEAMLLTTEAMLLTTEAMLLTTEAMLLTTEAMLLTTEAMLLTTEAMLLTTEAMLLTTEAMLLTTAGAPEELVSCLSYVAFPTAHSLEVTSLLVEAPLLKLQVVVGVSFHVGSGDPRLRRHGQRAHGKQQGRVCLPALSTPAAERPGGNAVAYLVRWLTSLSPRALLPVLAEAQG
ncbi:unnamed protein product [Closterium sp. NIES-64]|nr:unnamed protein product [Closterium sp. NIES-64]